MAEAARNLVCVGAVPTAVTNNLNFGNPLKSHIYYQLREAVLGMAEACDTFETPVTGGNVSLYNETDGRAIYPTPVIGMVGVIEDVEKITPQAFQRTGDIIVLLGTNTNEIGGSEYLYITASLVAGTPPAVNLDAERSLQQAVLEMNYELKIRSAHDCSEGGLACALAEAVLDDGDNPFGASVTLDDQIRPVPLLFGEGQGRIIVSCDPLSLEAVLRIAKKHDVPAIQIGYVTEASEGFQITTREGMVSASLSKLSSTYFDTLSSLMTVTTASS